MLKKKSFLERITGSMRFEDEKEEEEIAQTESKVKKLTLGERGEVQSE
jgi:hypothetical protein